MPAQLIDKGQPDPGLLAQVVIAKCCDHLPLYRQQAIYHRAGVDIPRSAVLEGWQGTLVVDDYTGYKTLFTQPDIQEVACWAHVRRKFFDQFNVNKGEVAQEALNRIRALYQLERKVKHRKLCKPTTLAATLRKTCSERILFLVTELARPDFSRVRDLQGD